MLSLYKLEVFVIITQEGSFNKAAQRLYLTQSAISQHIQSLETSLGTRLFDRSPRGVKLTESGDTLLKYAQKILALVTEAENALIDVGGLSGGQLKLGATPSASIYLLPGWIQEFFRCYPVFRTSLYTDITPKIITRILGEHLDFGFVEGEFEPSSQLQFLELQDISLKLIVRANHALRNYEHISLQSLNTEKFIMRHLESRTRIWLNEFFIHNKFSPHVIAEFDEPEAIKQAVMNGLGITILPTCMVEKEQAEGKLVSLDIDELSQKRTLKLLWKSDVPLTPISLAFLECLIPKFPILQDLIQKYRLVILT